MPKKKVICRKVKRVKCKQTLYSVKQKIQVVEYTKEQENNKAAGHFNVSRNMVGRWVRASLNWNLKTNKKSKQVGSDRKAFFPEAEKRLYDWTISQKKQGLAVSYAILRSKMIEILRESDMLELY